MKLCAVDPGVEATGLALFTDNKLEHVRLVRASSLQSMIQAIYYVKWPHDYDVPDLVFIERPVVYPRDGIKKAASLMTVAIVAGAAAAAYGRETWTTIDFVEPRTWKGSVPKEIHNTRVISILEKDEQEILISSMDDAPPSLLHNVIDAVGIGLYKLGRM